MNIISRLTDIARSPSDPEVLSKGPNVRGPSDRLYRALGWFSIALGLTELLAARRMRARSAWKVRRRWCALMAHAS
jgi:hypothetical protein